MYMLVPPLRDPPLTTQKRDAYYHPTVDESTEPFKWGMPDLDALRGYVPLPPYPRPRVTHTTR